MILITIGYEEDIFEQMIFEDKELAVEQAKVFYKEKNRDTKYLQEFAEGKRKKTGYSGAAWFTIQEIPVSHTIIKDLSEIY